MLSGRLPPTRCPEKAKERDQDEGEGKHSKLTCTELRRERTSDSPEGDRIGGMMNIDICDLIKYQARCFPPDHVHLRGTETEAVLVH